MRDFYSFLFSDLYIINEWTAENWVMVSWDQNKILQNTLLLCYLEKVAILAFRERPYDFRWISDSKIKAFFLILLILEVYEP